MADDQRQGDGDREPTVQDLLRIIRQQNESLANQANALRQMQIAQTQASAEATQERQAAREARELMLQEVTRVEGAGGIYGYAAGRPLEPNEQAFHGLIIGLGVNRETADEVFRQGLTSTETLKRLTSEKLKNIIYNISRNKSPNCPPDPSKIFLGAAFEDKLTVLISWTQFQRIIGAPSDSQAWISDRLASKKTIERLQYYREIKDSEGTEDITLPEPLKEMKKFRFFREHLLSYLRVKRGAANVPLAYVIRHDTDVTDEDRNGTVGSDPGDTYRNWDDYCIRCTALKGTHWDSDNASFWQILSKLVRDGPGWDFIRSFEKIGDGDGRGAFKSLEGQAFQFTNVRMIRDEARNNLRTLKYHGPTRNWNYEKYVRAWLRNIKTLKEFEDCPKEETLVSDFCAGITDPRLDNPISLALQEDSPYVRDFEKTQKYFMTVLAIAERRDIKSNPQRVSSTRTGASNGNPNSTAKFTGKLEAKPYSPKEWFSMTKEQKDQVRKLRQEAKRNGKRNTSEVETEKVPKDAGTQFGSNAHKSKRQKTQGKENDTSGNAP